MYGWTVLLKTRNLPFSDISSSSKKNPTTCILLFTHLYEVECNTYSYIFFIPSGILDLIKTFLTKELFGRIIVVFVMLILLFFYKSYEYNWY